MANFGLNIPEREYSEAILNFFVLANPAPILLIGDLLEVLRSPSFENEPTFFAKVLVKMQFEADLFLAFRAPEFSVVSQNGFQGWMVRIRDDAFEPIISGVLESMERIGVLTNTITGDIIYE